MLKQRLLPLLLRDGLLELPRGQLRLLLHDGLLRLPATRGMQRGLHSLLLLPSRLLLLHQRLLPRRLLLLPGRLLLLHQRLLQLP